MTNDLAERIERVKDCDSDEVECLSMGEAQQIIRDLLAIHKQAIEALGMIKDCSFNEDGVCCVCQSKITEALRASESIKHLLTTQGE